MQTEQVSTKEVRARGSPRSLAQPHAFLLGTTSRGATGQPRVLLLGWKLKLGQIFAFGVAVLRFSPRRRGSGLLSAPRAPAVSAAHKPVSLFAIIRCSWHEPCIAMVLYSLSNYSICVDVEYNSHPTLIILSWVSVTVTVSRCKPSFFCQSLLRQWRNLCFILALKIKTKVTVLKLK